MARNMKSDVDFHVFLSLYWAEGDKTGRVGLSNSDPRLIELMMKWFRACCQVPEGKFRVYLHRHSGQDDQAMKFFWQGVTGLPLSQFGKSFVKQEGTGHCKKRLYYGTIKINVSNRNLLHRIHGWIEGHLTHFNGPLAQLAEHLTLNQGVDGSIPSRPTIYRETIVPV